jgi:hypothetical protein
MQIRLGGLDSGKAAGLGVAGLRFGCSLVRRQFGLGFGVHCGEVARRAESETREIVQVVALRHGPWSNRSRNIR